MSTSQAANRLRGTDLPADIVPSAPRSARTIAGASTVRLDPPVERWHVPSWSHGGGFGHRMGFPPAWHRRVGRALRWGLVLASIGIVAMAIMQ